MRTFIAAALVTAGLSASASAQSFALSSGGGGVPPVALLWLALMLASRLNAAWRYGKPRPVRRSVAGSSSPIAARISASVSRSVLAS